MRDPHALIAQIQSVLDPSLLKSGYGGDHPLAGHCYSASEALYHALGGCDYVWHPVRARDEDGVVHWWLEDEKGAILDPTAEQYTDLGKTPPYSKGRRGGFLTKAPSYRARTILDQLDL